MSKPTTAMVSNKAEQFKTLQDFLYSKQKAFAGLLPKHLTAERMIRLLLGQSSRNPRILECTPQSVLMALMDASYYGLEPNPVLGHAYVIPYKNNKRGGIYEAQFMAGYKGLILLSTQCGAAKAIDAELVYERDVFKEVRHLQPPFVHEPETFAEDRGKVRGVYAVAYLPNGHVQFKPLSVSDVDKYRQRSRASEDGPWVTDWEAMAKKTAVRRLMSLLPLQTDSKLATALGQETDFEEHGPTYTAAAQSMIEGANVSQLPSRARGDDLAERLAGGKETAARPDPRQAPPIDEKEAREIAAKEKAEAEKQQRSEDEGFVP